MKAVQSDLTFVKACCPPGYYKSVWDRLCEQLFGSMPVGMNGDEQIPDVDIWKDGVSLISSEDPYSFNVITESSETPKVGDVIEYKGQYYIIGAVDA